VKRYKEKRPVNEGEAILNNIGHDYLTSTSAISVNFIKKLSYPDAKEIGITNPNNNLTDVVALEDHRDEVLSRELL
jgi:hypothetical protein